MTRERAFGTLALGIALCVAAPVVSAGDEAGHPAPPRTSERGEAAQDERTPERERAEEWRARRAERRADVEDDPVELAAKREALAAEIAQVEAHIERLRDKQRHLESARDAIDHGRPIEEIREALRRVPFLSFAPFRPGEDEMTLQGRFGDRRGPRGDERSARPVAAPPVDLEQFEEFLLLLKEFDPETHQRMVEFRERDPERFMERMSEKRGEWMSLLQQSRDEPAIFELRMRSKKLEWRSRSVSRRLILAEDDDEAKAARRELRALIAEQFEIALDISRLHFAEAAKVVQQLAAEIDEQKANAPELIEARLEQVVSEQRAGRGEWEGRQRERSARDEAPPRRGERRPKAGPERVN